MAKLRRKDNPKATTEDKQKSRISNPSNRHNHSVRQILDPTKTTSKRLAKKLATVRDPAVGASALQHRAQCSTPAMQGHPTGEHGITIITDKAGATANEATFRVTMAATECQMTAAAATTATAATMATLTMATTIAGEDLHQPHSRVADTKFATKTLHTAVQATIKTAKAPIRTLKEAK